MVSVFLFAFVLNFFWEHAHASLYAHYQGGEITDFVLFRAALFDAALVALLSIPFLFTSFFKKRGWFMILAGVLCAVLLEWFALATGRWEYAAAMPIVPLLGTGLTPTIQLGVLGYLSLWCVHSIAQRT